ncbi:30S ribosomal protein S6 [bacterium endosymbiont of Pedicinus badii]|nr:30S ribosomal protein S6 [bacterium endosymbiont of Pedicinus badii]
MYHYELVFMVHPDYSSKISKILDKYEKFILTNNGKIHRKEDWNRRQLAYSINNLKKAHYILMNFEIKEKNTILKIKKMLKMDSCIIRNIIIKNKKFTKGISPILKIKEEKKEQNTT